MLYMNDYDLEHAKARFTRASKPNRLALAMVVDQLRVWTNEVSDGWHSWPLPCRAAKTAMQHIESRTNAENRAQEEADISHEEMMLAIRPIKSLLTRHAVSPQRREIILRAVSS